MSGLRQSLLRFGLVRVPGTAVFATQEVSTPPLIVRRQTFTNPIASDDDYFVLDFAGPNATTVTKLKAAFDGVGGVTGLISDTYARNAVITVAHASAVVALSGVISGVDIFGNAITEAWSVTAGGTSKVFTGVVAFRRVDSITVIAATDASGDTVRIGIGTKLGLDRVCTTARLLAEEQNGVNPTAGTIVKASAAASTDPRGTYAPNSAADGAKDYNVWYLTETIDRVGLGQ